MTDNKNFCVSALYDLLKDDGINIKWEGNRVHLYRPGGLSNLRKIAFRNFKGELQPFTNIDLPKLKADVLLMSDGLKTINLTSDDTYNIPGNINYVNNKINKILSIDKAWTYYESDEGSSLTDGQDNITENIKELFALSNISLNDYFARTGLYDTIDLTDLTTWDPLSKFYNIQNPLNPIYSPLIVDNQKNIYYYDSSDSSIKSFTLTDNYFKGYPLEDGKNIIVGFENGNDGYYMNVYYGTAPNLSRLYHQFLPYCTNQYSLGGVQPLPGKYYNNYVVNLSGDYPVICVPYIDPSTSNYKLYFFQITETAHTTIIDLNSVDYSTILRDFQIYITAEELQEVYILYWGSNINTNNLIIMLKVLYEGENYYVIQDLSTTPTYSTDFAISITAIEQTFYPQYDNATKDMFIRLGNNDIFGGYICKGLLAARYSTSLRFNVAGHGYLYTHDTNAGATNYIREEGYFSNIVSGYYNDGTHILAYIKDSTTQNKFYKGMDISTYTGNGAIEQTTKEDQYYDISLTYGQFLNGGPILFYDDQQLTPDILPNAVRIVTTIKSDVKCVATDTSDNAVYLNPRYGDVINFGYHFNPFVLTSITNNGEDITGQAYIPEIYFNGHKANIILKIYTEPYYFELITQNTYIENTTDYNMNGILTNLIYRASNDNILKMLEYLILLRYNNNNIIMKCANFSNNDGAVFNINDESRIDFKAMITDNTQQEIVITLEGNDGTPITYDVLKEIYAHCCVSIDWIQ